MSYSNYDTNAPVILIVALILSVNLFLLNTLQYHTGCIIIWWDVQSNVLLGGKGRCLFWAC